ncbi:MAG: transposase [Clostridiaceae bacterium]|nr:transposase [Clostridiaceae bacterium]
MQVESVLNINPDTINCHDPNEVKKVLKVLFNFVETLNKKNQELKKENQELKDEVNRLKGEKGKPQIKPKTNNNVSAPKQKKTGKKKRGKKKRSKKNNIPIDNTETVEYKGELPVDAQFKGYRLVVVQNIIIKTNNIEYKLERYYSASEGKTYEASLPDGIDPYFSANIKSWIIKWYFDCRMSEAKIHQLLTDIGIQISRGYISNILTKGNDVFHNEKNELVLAGINSSNYQHIDDTGARVSGENQYFSVLCNDFYTAFFTNPRKDRTTVIKILQQTDEIPYLINHHSLSFLEEKKLKSSILEGLYPFLDFEAMNKENFLKEITRSFPKLRERHIDRILEAGAIGAYREQKNNVFNILVCDDAKQFFNITKLRSLCWIHEGRHYKKLIPIFDYHKKILEYFLKKFWIYYRKLIRYKKNPTKALKKKLDTEFNKLFGTNTGYAELDERIRLTRNKKKHLLVVLDYPEVPLHNNIAELAIRIYVIKRKISFGTKSADGTRSWETFFSILDTCRKLNIDFREYVLDRISGIFQMPSLAQIIEQVST